jgi:two-component system, response regulator
MTRALSIMLIDDEENDALLFRLAVDSLGQGHTTSTFTNVPDAIQNLQNLDTLSRPLPDLVLVDLRMPGMNGLHLVRWLREHPRLHSIPTVVMSAAETRRDVQEAFQLGARGYLVKPSTYDELVNEVQDLLALWEPAKSRSRRGRNSRTVLEPLSRDRRRQSSPPMPGTAIPLVPPSVPGRPGTGFACS